MTADSNLFDVSGQHILITGASGGIGRQIAILLSQMGATVGLNGRNVEELENTYNMLSGKGHYIVAADLLLLDDTTSIFERAIEMNGKLDGMIYSAGVVPTIPLRAMSIKKSDSILKINVTAFIDMSRNFSKKKYSNGGSIIGISSVASTHPEKGQTIYAASKAAMNAAIQVMALELIEKDIRINAILPGVVMSAGISEKIIKEYVDGQQLIGLINPNDIGKLCIFLLSNAARSISGQLHYIDGLRI